MTATVTTRVDRLEQLLGDPWQPDAPLTNDVILAADERSEMSTRGEELLDEFGFGAEFVPVAYGGRLDRLDDFLTLSRAVWRRDPTLGLGHGFASFIAGVNIWAAGTPGQCRRAAGLLLGNAKLSSVYHELEHGNDFSRIEVSARPHGPDHLALHGRKAIITNVGRASALVVLARTSAEPGSRSISQILVDRAALPADGITDLPRYPTVGMRGLMLAGVDFDGYRVPAGAVLGEPGRGIEVALRSFQLTRTAMPAMAAGVLDTGLRATMRFTGDRRLYGRPVASLPAVQAELADAFTDLLIVDALAMSTARAIHALPEETVVAASATKFLGSRRLLDAMNRLSRVLGAHFYVRDGEYAIFQKLLRDLAPAGFGHAARVACLVTMLPQLPILARRAWANPPVDAPAAIYRRGADLPPLSFDALAVRTKGGDSLTGALHAAAEATAVADPRLHRLATAFVAELAALTESCATLEPRDLGPAAQPEALAVASRYATVLAASACLNVWRHERDDPFLGDPTWAVAALHRLARAGRLPVDPGLAATCRPALYIELAARFAGHRTFDLADRPLPV
ncbi:acyl-CoA dehydrogenase [Actinoplanes sp. TBRC 11911]|uniref:acyl-CoA dehydrogenase n=1 Tax=Actinoplanes sp. TBRC 11911 TaxID=2729386 RepID=UPI00145E96FA|nr:acyl-CoA dehydrogenase [Actinoplanes sp. TBRC 11911]NMO53352.1 acyl-CoA dehydrogenase [Actinoplanes sp. TBRC 11911]